jgi:hypothetical protein
MTGHPSSGASAIPSGLSSANHPGPDTETGWPLDTEPLRG